MGRMVVSETDRTALLSNAKRSAVRVGSDMRLTKSGSAPKPLDEDVFDAALSGVDPTDTYSSRLLKYIPAEVIALYITLDGLMKSRLSHSPHVVAFEVFYWLIFIFGIVVTPIYLFRVLRVTKRKQLVISAFAFAVWVFAIGGPFSLSSYYDPGYGAIVLPIYTFLVALIDA